MFLPKFIKSLSLLAFLPLIGWALPLATAEKKVQHSYSCLERKLYPLPLEQQADYALILYRTTGDKVWLNTARATLYLSSDRLQKLATGIQSSTSRKELLHSEASSFKSELLDKHEDYFFYAFLVLPQLSRIDRFSMVLKGGLGEGFDRAMSSINFKKGLTSPELLEEYAPTLAKHVYHLLNLDYGDYRKFFIEAFRAAYPDIQDRTMSEGKRQRKWKTMANLVLAASGYLQRPVNDPLLEWIPKYFAANELYILRQGDDELLAKVGLALLLTGVNNNNLLRKIKERMSNRQCSDQIRAADFWSMLLLGWKGEYRHDPAFYKMEKFKNKTPYILKPFH